MVNEPKRPTKRLVPTLMTIVLLTGLAVLVAASITDEAPAWWWVAGGAATLFGGIYVLLLMAFRMIRYPTEEAGEANRDNHFSAPGAIPREKLARQAIAYKDLVLRSGVDGTATITLIANARRGNEFQHLLYLELKVSVGDGDPYPVKTGEYVDAASMGSVAPGRQLNVKVDRTNPQRVAVHWERSLRLPKR